MFDEGVDAPEDAGNKKPSRKKEPAILLIVIVCSPDDKGGELYSRVDETLSPELVLLRARKSSPLSMKMAVSSPLSSSFVHP